MNTQDRYFNQLAEAGRAVVERRLQLGLSQAALASAAGVDAKTLRSLERGERWPQDTSRVKVERALAWQDGTLHALFVGDFLWKELDQPDGSRSGGLIYLRAPSQAAPDSPSPASSAAVESLDVEAAASELTASELAALLVTRSQAQERRIRELERELSELRTRLDDLRQRERDEHADEDAASMERDAEPDGLTSGESRRPLGQDDFARAADDSGPSLLEADDARSAARGEESQDPGSDEPA